MNTAVKITELENKILSVQPQQFEGLSLEVFRFQYEQDTVYRKYCDALKTNPHKIDSLLKIPFLPISFFKTHRVVNGDFPPEAVFESSGTTSSVASRHFVKDISLYKKNFTSIFKKFYGGPSDWCILGLLPSYLERNNSSLVLMVDDLIRQSSHPLSGFYLDDFEKLQQTILQTEKQGQKTLLIGVTFALLDFAEKFPMKMQHTIVMETGGMKGRKKEMTRQQVHEILCNAFQLKNIHSEYGMTELLSQAYSCSAGIFKCAPQMKILIRDDDDPFELHDASGKTVSGAINVIDLANIHSCSFIATEDAGRLYADGNFEVMGRLDNTDVRGCSLLSL